ncbi:hypothetical protein Tco_0887255 [Tanacetum coccineum]
MPRTLIPLRPNLGVLQIGIKSQGYREPGFLSTSLWARSWSILSVDPYEEAARQLLEQAPRPSKYVPDLIELENHVQLYIPEPEHPADLVPVGAAMTQRRAITPSMYLSLLLAGTPLLLPIPLPAPPLAVELTFPRLSAHSERLLLTAPTPRVEVGESSAAIARIYFGTQARSKLLVSYQADVRRRESLGFYSRHQEAQEDRAAVRAEIEILRRERLAYEQESIRRHQALARSEAYNRALEARIRVLETQAYHHE